MCVWMDGWMSGWMYVCTMYVCMCACVCMSVCMYVCTSYFHRDFISLIINGLVPILHIPHISQF